MTKAANRDTHVFVVPQPRLGNAGVAARKTQLLACHFENMPWLPASTFIGSVPMWLVHDDSGSQVSARSSTIPHTRLSFRAPKANLCATSPVFMLTDAEG